MSRRIVTLIAAGCVMVCGLLLLAITVAVANMIDPQITGWARFAILVEKLFGRGFIVPTVVSLLMVCSPPAVLFFSLMFRRARG